MVEVDDIHSIAIVEISLNDHPQRVVVVVDDWQDDDARLGARAVVQTETNSAIRRVLRGERPRQQTNGGNGERQRQPHFRNSGSKLKTTGKASSGKPSGNGPNASALAAASTAPCASRSNEKFPDRLMN